MMRAIRTLTAGCVVLLACNEAAESTAQEPAPVESRHEVSVGAHGYEPSSIQAAAGQPLTLVVTRTTDEGCGDVLAIPSRDIRRDLPLNEPVEIRFTPSEAGSIRFTCGMDMYDGTIVVQ